MGKSRKNKIARLDKLWGAAVVERDGKICQKCGEFGDNPHHMISRRYLATRHVLDNGLTLCTKHHVPYAHNQVAAFLEWFREKHWDRWVELQILKYEFKPDLDKIEMELKGG